MIMHSDDLRDLRWYLNSIPAHLQLFRTLKEEQINAIINTQINPPYEPYPTYYTAVLSKIHDYPESLSLGTIVDAYHHVYERLKSNNELDSCLAIMNTMFDICSYWNILLTLPFGDLVRLQFQTLIQTFVNLQDNFTQNDLQPVYEVIQSKLISLDSVHLPKKSISFTQQYLSELSQINQNELLPSKIDLLQLQQLYKLPSLFKQQAKQSPYILLMIVNGYSYVPPKSIVEDHNLMRTLAKEIVPMYFHQDFILNLFSIGKDMRQLSKQFIIHIVKVGIILLQSPIRSEPMESQAIAAEQLIRDFLDFVLPNTSNERELIQSEQILDPHFNKPIILAEFEEKKNRIDERLQENPSANILQGGYVAIPKFDQLRIYLTVLFDYLRSLYQPSLKHKIHLIQESTYQLEDIPLTNIHEAQLLIAYTIVRHLIVQPHISEYLILATNGNEWLTFLSTIALLPRDKVDSKETKFNKTLKKGIQIMSNELSRPTIEEFNMLNNSDLLSLVIDSDVPYEIQAHASLIDNTIYGGIVRIEDQQITAASHIIITNFIRKESSQLGQLQVIQQAMMSIPWNCKKRSVLVKCDDKAAVDMINVWLRKKKLLKPADQDAAYLISQTVQIIAGSVYSFEINNGIKVKFEYALEERNKIAQFLSKQKTIEELMTYSSTIISDQVEFNVSQIQINVQYQSLKFKLCSDENDKVFSTQHFNVYFGKKWDEYEQNQFLQGLISILENQIIRRSLNERQFDLQITVKDGLYDIIKTTFQNWKYQCSWKISLTNGKEGQVVEYESIPLNGKQKQELMKMKNDNDDYEFKELIKIIKDFNEEVEEEEEKEKSVGQILSFDEEQLIFPIIEKQDENLTDFSKEFSAIPFEASEDMINEPKEKISNITDTEFQMNKTEPFRIKYIKRLLCYQESRPKDIWNIIKNFYWTKIMKISKGSEIIQNQELGWIPTKICEYQAIITAQ